MKEHNRKIKWLDEVGSIPEKPDFDEILKGHARLKWKKMILKSGIILTSVTSIIAVIALVLNEPANPSSDQQEQTNEDADTTAFDEYKNYDTEELPLIESIGISYLKRNLRPVSIPGKPASKLRPLHINNPASILSRPAYPKVGFDSLNNYFGHHMNSLSETVDGEFIVYLFFDVNVDGSASSLVVQGIEDSLFTTQLSEIVYNMPPWWPSIKEGIPVKSSFKLPLQIIETDSTQRER